MLYPVFNAEKKEIIMRLVAIALIMLACAPDALAWIPKEGQQRVVVYDYTSEVWEGVVVETVADMNAVLPHHAPHLTYRRMPSSGCKKHRYAITVCSVASLVTWDATTQHFLNRVRIDLDDSTLGVHEKIACEEMMHALTAIHDLANNYPDSSCVLGSLTDPGPFDVQKLKQIYGKKHRH
jgi:hypothetical protein